MLELKPVRQKVYYCTDKLPPVNINRNSLLKKALHSRKIYVIMKTKKMSFLLGIQNCFFATLEGGGTILLSMLMNMKIARHTSTSKYK